MILAVADPADLADAGAFLARVVRLDAGALVRLRAGGRTGLVALWSWLPLDVLATRMVAGRLAAEDATVAAADLLDAVRAGGSAVTLPARRDVEWRGALPSGRDPELERIPADVVRRLVAAGEDAFRSASGAQAAGEALLDHETLRVSAGGIDVVVPLRMLLGLARMGFLAEDDAVRVGAGGGWLRLAGRYGTVYRRAERGRALTLSIR